MILLWKIIILVFFFPVFGDCQFENQYLGHYLTRDQYNSQQLACDSKVCLRDAQLLLLAATQNKTIKPCDDFAEFSMGQFKKLGALNERYSFIGFMRDLVSLDWERKRKVLAEKTKDTDIRPFKIAKNFYQRCVNSDNVRMNGSVEILQHVKSYGGAPFLDSSWDENAFNIKELFNKEPFNAVYFFLNQTIELCTHPTNKSREIVCLRKSNLKKFNGIEVDDSIQVFKVLNIDVQLIHSVYNKSINYRKSQTNLSEIDVNPGVFTVSSLNDLTNNTLNWLKIINSHLIIESQLTEDSEIFIQNPELIVQLLELMNVTPKETIADFFSFIFLYLNKQLFLVYSFDIKENKRLGTIKSKQRWEQCVRYLYHNFGPALRALYAAKYYRKEVHDSVKILMKEAVKDLIVEINKLDIKDEAKLDVVERLNTARYVIGFPEEVLDLQIIDDFYDELELDGTEGIVECLLKIEKNNKKLKMYPESKKQFYWLSDFTIKFVLDENVILIHQLMILYPFYHPNRSHFFNIATLYQFTAESMNHLIKLYLQTKWDTRMKLIDTIELAYKNYVKWEESGGKELTLPGFFLTNRQMFWVALAHKKYHKFQTGISKITVKKFQHRHTHFHLQFKNQQSFRQAYNCTELTEDENNKLNKYYLEKEMFERQYIIDYQLKYP